MVIPSSTVPAVLPQKMQTPGPFRFVLFGCLTTESLMNRKDEYSEKEAAARRDAIVKRMIAMPPKPHSEMKIGGKSQKKKSSKKAKKASPKREAAK
jgi:hypothetical protein